MKTGRKATGSPSEKLKQSSKPDRSTTRSPGSRAKKKHPKPADIQFANIVEEMHEGFVALDRQMNYVYLNQWGSKLLERKPEDLIGKNYWDEYPQDRDTSFGEAYVRALENQTPIMLEDYYAPRERWFENRIYPSATGLSIFFNDITERKHIEQSLMREREILKRLFETMPVMVSMYDPETNSLQLNAEFERIIGWKSTEVSVASLLEALYPDPEYRQNVLQRMAVAGKNDWVEVQVQTRDGRTLDSLWSNVSILSDQQLAAGIALGIDITERKHAEGALQHTREQVEATAGRVARLQQIIAALAASVTPTEFAEKVLEQFTQAADAKAGILMKLLDNGNEIKAIAALGYPEGAVRDEPILLSEPTTISDCIRTRQAVWIESQEEFAKQYPAMAQRRGGFGLEATLALPLIAGERVLGALALSFVEPRQFSSAEREFFLAVAQQCSQGLEKARSEEALRTSEARLRLATEAAGIFAWELDLETQAYTVADNFAEVLGFSADILPKTMPQTLQTLISEEDVAIFTEALNKSIKNGTDLRNLQYRIANPETGQVVWLEVNAKNIYDRDGTPRQMLGVAQNITESKQTEGYIHYLNTELKARLDEMNTLMNILPTGVWIGNHDCSEITGNPAAYPMLGLPPNTNVSATNADSDMPPGVRMFVEGMEVPPEEAPMQQVARTGKPFYNFEHELLFADGTRKGIYGSVVPLFNEQGAVRKVIGTYMDFTERKEAERRLILLTHITELLRKLEDQNELLYAISHAVGEHLRVKRCLFNEIDLENDTEIVHQDYCRGVPSVAGIHKVSEYSNTTTTQIMAGKTIVNTDSKVDVRTAADYEHAYAPNGERAYVAVPMMREQRWVASLWVSDDTPRQWSKEEVSLLESIAERTWIVIEKMRINEALRESEERYRSLFDLVPVAVYTCDADGLIQEFNTHAVELWGREPRLNDVSEKFCGSFKLYYPDGTSMANEKCPMARVLQGETLEPSELEIIVERPDGIRRNVVATPLPLKNENGEIMEGINCLYDITERKQAEAALQQLNLELENRVERRTVQLQRANQALEEGRKRLQILSQRLVEVQEDERRAIARELHDRVGQSLAALSLNLTIISNQLMNQANEQVNTRLLDSTQLVKEVIALVRDVMANLRPTVLDDYGLEVALQSNLDQLKSRYGINILFEKADPAIPRLGPSIEMTILRITQEALLNIVKHAQADQAALSLHLEEQIISLIIRDNGSGIKSWQEANRPGSHGLMIMRERAEAVGGTLRISSQPGKGTQIQVDIPFQPKTPKEHH